MKYKGEYKLNKLDIKSNSIIVMKYNIKDFDLEEIYDMFISLKDTISPIPIVAIPEGIELEVTEKENLLNYLKSI